MKKLILVSLLALGLGAGFVYAENKAALELEHQIKTVNDAESVGEDMSAMKAAGKCNADQVAKKKVPKKKAAQKPANKAALELEHQNRLQNDEESVGQDMGNMKAQGKCNTGK